MKDNKTFPPCTAVAVHGLSHELLNGNYILNIREQSRVKSPIVNSFRSSLAVTSLAKYLPFRVRLWVRYASLGLVVMAAHPDRGFTSDLTLSAALETRSSRTLSDSLDLQRPGSVMCNENIQKHTERAIMNIGDWCVVRLKLPSQPLMFVHSYLCRWFLNKLKICTEWCAPVLAESFTDAFRWDLIQIILFPHTLGTPTLTLGLTPFPHTLRVLDDIPSVARWTKHHPRPHKHGLKSQIFRLNSVAQLRLRRAEKEGGSTDKICFVC